MGSMHDIQTGTFPLTPTPQNKLYLKQTKTTPDVMYASSLTAASLKAKSYE